MRPFGKSSTGRKMPTMPGSVGIAVISTGIGRSVSKGEAEFRDNRIRHHSRSQRRTTTPAPQSQTNKTARGIRLGADRPILSSETGDENAAPVVCRVDDVSKAKGWLNS